MSADPAMESYIPEASSNQGAGERNQNLPGMGGIYNSRNLQTYHYAGNNPLKYSDPTGGEAATLAVASTAAASSGPVGWIIGGVVVAAVLVYGGIQLWNNSTSTNQSSNTTSEEDQAKPAEPNPTTATTPSSTTGGTGNDEDPNDEDDNQDNEVKPDKDPYWTSDRVKHTFQGEGKYRGGGHYNQSKAETKSQFNQNQSIQHIQNAVQKAARDPNTQWSRDPRTGNLVTTQYIEGQGWVKIVAKPSGEIVTAYPVNGPPTTPAE